jgi:hypothetical protein
MKLITCPRCKEKLIGPKSDRWPRGGPVIMSRWVGRSNFPVVLKCHRCTGAVKLTVVDFNRLPSMTPEQVRELAPSAQGAVD